MRKHMMSIAWLSNLAASHADVPLTAAHTLKELGSNQEKHGEAPDHSQSPFNDDNDTSETSCHCLIQHHSNAVHPHVS